MPANKPINYRKQIAMGYKPEAPKVGKPAKFGCGGQVDKTQYQNYGNGIRKVKAK